MEVICPLSPREEERDKLVNVTQAFIALENSSSISPRSTKEDILSHGYDTSTRQRVRHPVENVKGISEEYLAMTKACIHDHDYFAVDRLDPYPPREQPASHFVIKDSAIHAVELRKSGMEVRPEINRANIRVRPRRIVRKCSSPSSTAASTVNPFVSTTPKHGLKQTLVIRNYGDGIKLKVPSPRPSITPFPPVEKNCRRIFEEKKVDQSDESIENQSGLHNSHDCNTSADSAYSSLTCSSNSQPCSVSRPPSGGKRSAAGGIFSSSSSDFSSDDCSDAERRTLKLENGGDNVRNESSMKSDKPTQDEEAVSMKSRHVTRSGKKIRRQFQRSDGRPVDQEQNTVQYLPAPPPSKPKKGRNFRAVPMRLRALPTSFWEEPNQTNGTTYTILPPVTPLVHHEDGDISEIPPVSPMDDKNATRVAPSTSSCDHGGYHPIINAGDTDLLLRLFDQVETKTRSTAVKKKRGRAKRPEYVTMPSRRSSNQNPCIIDSITDKLFPKLSLDNRQTLAALTRTVPRRTPVEIIGQDVKLSNAGTCMTDAGDLLLLQQDDDTQLTGLNSIGETRIVQEAAPILVERSSRLLPHLSPHKDYSQLLNELTAVL